MDQKVCAPGVCLEHSGIVASMDAVKNTQEKMQQSIESLRKSVTKYGLILTAIITANGFNIPTKVISFMTGG